MFTGIISSVGKVLTAQKKQTPKGLELKLELETNILDAELGESIAVNGVCLTVTEIKKLSSEKSALHFFASQETLDKTNLGAVQTSSVVNLERALTLNQKLSGHMVQGHVDAQGKLKKISREGESHLLTIELPPTFEKYVISKGSITVDGISLTVNYLNPGSFEVCIIPHTWQNTSLHSKREGDYFNLEFDVIAKYVEKLVKPYG